MFRYASILMLAVAAPLLAACGSSDPSNNISAATKHSDAVAFAGCMRSHGVPNFPDPTGNGHGGLDIQASQRSGSGQSMKVNGVPVNAPAFQSAMQQCRSKLPNGGRPTAAEIATMHAKALRFSACMRSHGVPNFPDPQFGSGGGGEVRLSGAGLDPSSPAFKSAQAACGSIIGAGGFKTTQAAP
jgi:hypothetical protein